MTMAKAVGAVSRKAVEWSAIDWPTTQVRIVQATNRVSSEAFEGLEPCEGKLSRTVLRGSMDGSNPVPLLDRHYRPSSY